MEFISLPCEAYAMESVVLSIQNSISLRREACIIKSPCDFN
jgi:hypothetical protein